MLVLFETAVGFAVFKVSDESKLSKVENLYKEFSSAKSANKMLSLKHFERFRDTTEAISSATALIEGKMNKKLKKMLKKIVLKENEELAVSDAKLGNSIKDKLNIGCVTSSAIQELMTCIRSQIDNLIPEWSPEDEAVMQLGLSHGIGRYKLKFSPDKVDTMIIQAVSLLDDLDKELNNYVMRSKEWYGWHFPELSKIVSDNTAFIRTVLAIGMRTNATTTDLSDILPEEIEAKVKEMAEVSMGTEIAEEDMLNINHLCRNVLELQEYRTQLFEYLKNRMMAIAPNLTILVGELVGARLISHAGSLLNLAKHPASTVQILGAEKALFRALKTRHDTPKYGLLYHAQLIGQSNPKLKGKMSRMLAAKASLATRVDALGEETTNDLGTEHRAKLEARLKYLEETGLRAISGSGKRRAKIEKYDNKSQIHTYKAAADSTIGHSAKRKFEFEEPKEEDIDSTKVKTEESEESTPKESKKKKKKLKQSLESTEVEEPEETPTKKIKKEKKSKVKEEEEEPQEAEEEMPEESVETSSKKKKKKKKNQ